MGESQVVAGGTDAARSRNAHLVPRIWNGLTAALVLLGIVMDVVWAARAGAGTFGSPAAHAFNIFAYFTVQSNIVVGATTLLLALRWDRGTGADWRSTLFRVFRLDGLIMIIVTAVVYHAVLEPLLDLHGWDLFSDQIVHTVVPAFCIFGWLLWGPRRLVSWRIVGWCVVYPILWVVFTLVRGAITHWYPYPFMDVDELGYLHASLNLLGITVAFLALAAGALGVDRLLGRRGARV